MAVRSLAILRDGHFEIDKGLMVYLKTAYFGQRYLAPVRPLLVRTGEGNLLLDTGLGEIPEKLRRYYPVHRDSRLAESLAAQGLGPDDISIVVNTHLHFDHAGNNRMFPRARIIVQKRELDFARDPPRFLRGGYIRELFETPNLETVDGPARIVEGVEVIPTPGHTAGHQSVIIRMGDRKYIYTGDVSPVRENWETGIPVGILLDPMAASESLERCRALGASPIFSHDEEQWEI
jgi:glyoxylase-like metal-dependent hydrolase (beta-lactamase superfamily II)